MFLVDSHTLSLTVYLSWYSAKARTELAKANHRGESEDEDDNEDNDGYKDGY